MRLESVRELKQSLINRLVRPTAKVMASRSTLSVVEALTLDRPAPRRLVALGVSKGSGSNYRLAVRLQSKSLANANLVQEIEAAARQEVEVRFIGLVEKQQTPWTQQRHRPLKAGTSIGHGNITAGTLGAFAEGLNGRGRYVLSNNHVLADENRGRRGDAIVQPGSYDGGTPSDKVAELLRFVRLQTSGVNYVDAALARIADGLDDRGNRWRGLGAMTGVSTGPLAIGSAVAKLGRTTGVTRGRVTAIELDGLVVGFGIGDLVFDDQIEIEGAGKRSFSAGGDSGSLILDVDRNAVALLFAGGTEGGTNGKGLTYANPIGAVLEALRVRLST